MDAITIQTEDPDTFYWEALPLFAQHFQEISQYPDIPLDIDLDGYLQQARAGCLRVYTARSAGQLIGYTVFFVRRNLRYRSSLQASQDVLYLHPAYRKGRVGLKLIRFSEESLKAEGVQVLYQHVKAVRDEGRLMERLGYTLVDLLYAKRLDKE